MIRRGRKSHLTNRGRMILLTISLLLSHHVYAFQKGDWVNVTEEGDKLLVYNDTLTQVIATRREGQGGGILDGPHPQDSRFWKIRWDDRVEGWSAEKSRDGKQIWLDLFARYVITNKNFPNEVDAGSTWSLSVTVRNDGKGNITGNLFRMSAGVLISGVPTQDISAPVSGGSTKTFTVSFNIPSNTPGGTYYCVFGFYREIDGQPGFSSTGDYWLTGDLISFRVRQKPGELEVTPSDGLNSSGPQGGPFSPSSKQYTLKNIGGESISWSASVNQNWISVSSSSGSLNPGASTTVTVSINSKANSLSPGTYTGTVSFKNTTNGRGDTTRTVQLTVQQSTTFYTLTVHSNPVEGVTIVGVDPDNKAWTNQTPFSRSYSEGSKITLAPSPYHNRSDIQPITPLILFDRWEGVDKTTGELIAEVTMNSNRTLTAYYGQVTDLTGQVGAVTIEAPDVVKRNENFTITIRGRYTGTKSRNCKIWWVLSDIAYEDFSDDVVLPAGEFSFSRTVQAKAPAGQYEITIYLWLDKNTNGQLNKDERLAQVSKKITVSQTQTQVPVTIRTEFEGQTKIKVDGQEYVVPVGGLTLYWTQNQEYTVEFPEQVVTIGSNNGKATRQSLSRELILRIVNWIESFVPSKTITIKRGSKENEVKVKAQDQGFMHVKPFRIVKLTLKAKVGNQEFQGVTFQVNGEQIKAGGMREFAQGANVTVIIHSVQQSDYRFVGWKFEPQFTVASLNDALISFKLTHNATLTALYEQYKQTPPEAKIRITGKVTDLETGEPIPHVIIAVGEETAETDNEGNYILFLDDNPLLSGKSFKTYAPRRVWRQRDGKVVSYLSPVGVSNLFIVKENGFLKIGQSTKYPKISKTVNWYLCNVFEGGTFERETWKKWTIDNKNVIINMKLVPVHLGYNRNNDYQEIIKAMIKIGQQFKIPPHILMGIAMKETYCQQFDTSDVKASVDIDDGYTMINLHERQCNHGIQLTDSGIGMMQITGLTALQFCLEELGKLGEEGKSENVIIILERLATDIEENIRAGAWLLKNSGAYVLEPSQLNLWKNAVIRFSGREDYYEHMVNLMKNGNKFPKRLLEVNNSNKYLEPLPLTDEDWGKKDNDFDGKLESSKLVQLDERSKYFDKMHLVKRQAELREQEPNDTPEQANLLIWNEFLDGEISSEGDVDWFKFTGEQGQRFVVRVEPSGDEAIGEALLDPRITLYDENLNPLISNDDDWAGSGLGAAIRDFRLPRSGTYYLKVEDIVGRGGEGYGYFLQLKRELEDDYGDTVETAQLITIGQTISGYIGHEGDIDMFRFESPGNVALTAILEGPQESDPSLDLILLDEKGNWLTEGYFDWNSQEKRNRWVIREFPLYSDGNYYLVVRSSIPEESGDWLNYELKIKTVLLPKPVFSISSVEKTLAQGESERVTFNITNQGELPFKFQFANLVLSQEGESKLNRMANRMAPVFIPEEVLSRSEQSEVTRSYKPSLKQFPEIVAGRPVVVLPSGRIHRLLPSRQAPEGGEWRLLFVRTRDSSIDGPCSFSKIWINQSGQNLYFRFDLSGWTFKMSNNMLAVVLNGYDTPLKVAILGLDRGEVWAWSETDQQFQPLGNLVWQNINGNQVEMGISWEMLGFTGNFSVVFLLLDWQTENLRYDCAPDIGWIEVNREVLWTQVEAAAGEIAGGDTVTINLNLNAEELDAGSYESELLVLSGDEIVKSLPIKVNVQPPSVPFESGAGLFMISLPITVDKQWHEIFDIPEEQMKLAVYNPTEGRYRLYGELSPDERKPKPGVGVWVKLDSPVQVNVTGTLPRTREPFVINLQIGWQIIGVPWQTKWTNLKVRKDGEELSLTDAAERGWVADILWTWDNEVGDYRMVWGGVTGIGLLETLDITKAYWILAFTDCQLVIPPKADAMRGISLPRKRLAENGFVFGLAAEDGQAKRRVWLGFVNATSGRGRNGRGIQAPLPPDSPEPSNIQIAVIGADGNPMAMDLKAGAMKKMEWDVVVRWTGQGQRGIWGNRQQTNPDEIILTWDGLGYLPKGMSAFLVDSVTGTRRYLRTQSSYLFRPQDGETERRFKVILEQGGTGLLRILNLKATPVRGQGVAIQFALTKPAMTKVEILTLTGRQIAIVETGQTRTAGQHTSLWRGEDGQGRKLPVGVYLVRVHAQDEEGRQVQAVTTVNLR